MLKVPAAKGSIFTRDGLVLSANGVLEGDGDIVANVSGSTGAKVRPGTSAPGVVNSAGSWNNRRITIQLEIDDLSSSALAGVDYDLLNVQGSFAHGSGSAVTIDTSQFVAGLVTEIKMIGWTSQVSADVGTTVAFRWAGAGVRIPRRWPLCSRRPRAGDGRRAGLGRMRLAPAPPNTTAATLRNPDHGDGYI